MTGAEHLKFLYPSSRQYPFDTVVESIVRELGARGWECPALQELQVDFKSYGDSEHGFFKVSKISARDFSLEFERCQGRLGHGGWNNTAAVSRLQIPGAELKVYDDESGPLYFQYGGLSLIHI